MRVLPALAATAAGALAVWLAVGPGFANYDTLYGLVWGRDVAHGRVPDYGVPVAPTPHPLATLAGVVLTPLGDAAEGAVVLSALLFLGALGWVTYALGAHWFGPAAGLLAAAIILTRQPVLSFGVRGYVDIPYLVLVLGALLVEARSPRAGVPVLALLGLAGLLRPEAWLFAAAYVGWAALDPARRADRRGMLILAATAAVGPVIWALADLAVTGDPLYSLTGTRENAQVLERTTGLDSVPLTVPRRLGEILREPVLLGAALGGVLSLALLRSRAALPAAAGVLSIVAFCVLAAAGLPILGRYLLLPATLLAIFCGAGAFGWLLLPRDHPWRRRWLALGAVAGLALVAFTPRQVERIDSLRAAIGLQRTIVSDLHALAGSGEIDQACGPVAVPNHRLVPLLALRLDRPPAEIVSAQLTRPDSGHFVAPATPRVARNFILDPNDPKRLAASVPAGFERVTANASWILFARCR
jgi:hypothetical protein